MMDVLKTPGGTKLHQCLLACLSSTIFPGGSISISELEDI